MRRQNLESATHTWLRDSLFILGASCLSNGYISVPLEVSTHIQLRWLSKYGVKAAIEDNLDNPLPRRVERFLVGNYDPLTLDCFHRDDRLVESDFAFVEALTVSYLPGLRIIRCVVCQERFCLERIKNIWYCDNCKPNSRCLTTFGYVYVFGCVKTGYFKIGYSKTPHLRRLEYDRSKMPFPTEMIHTIPADNARQLEWELHRRYRDKQTNGEWFLLSSIELDQIKAIKRRGLQGRVEA